MDGKMMDGVQKWIGKDQIDIVLVIGTAANVYPAAGYVHEAMDQGAVVVVVNPDPHATEEMAQMRKKDFFFQEDATEWLPKMFEDEIGKNFEKTEAAMEGQVTASNA